MISTAPQWAIVGSWTGGPPETAFMVVASKNIPSGDLEVLTTIVRVRAPLEQQATTATETEHHLDATLGDFQVVFGADYAECLRVLFGQWSPEPDTDPGANHLRQLGAEHLQQRGTP
ncbi:MAG: hypothetical protein ACRDXE_03280 [Acidimicrobiales bacterium]